MTINLHLPSQSETLKPKITVIGVGGAGGNAVNNMIAANLEGVDFVMANTDAQALESAMTDRTVQLGVTVTRGLGAGANPQVGGAAAEEALDEICEHIHGSHMVFITAGMGGGTGTGAAPVIARMAREQGILTVGVVTKPFQFEGTHRMRIADHGIEELQEFVDTLIVIPNQNLFRVANEKTTFADAFRMADEVLHSGVRGVTDLMVKPGLVNLDFADIRSVMSEMGKAMMGTGEADGEKRAIDAAESAISNPLLDDVSLRGASAVLINITGGPDMTLFEVDEAANRIRDEVDPEANIIFGSTFSDLLEGQMRVSVVATGIEQAAHAVTERTAKAMTGRPIEMRQTAMSNMGASMGQAKRERTAQEIVRDAGTMSASEIAKMASANVAQQEPQQHMQQQQMMQQEPQPAKVQADLVFDDFEAEAQYEEEKEEEQLRKPFRLGEVREQVGGPVFMPPRAEQPANRTFVKSNPVEDEVLEEMPESGMTEEGGSFNFFQKIAGVGKALSSKPDEEVVNPRAARAQAAGAAQARVAEVEPSAEEDEEYLDIPAFLRRQAN